MADLEYVREHFNPEDATLVGDGPLLGDEMWRAVDLMLAHCPVARSDARFIGLPHGGWIVSNYAQATAVLKDTKLFSSQVQRGERPEPPLIPMDLDPPLVSEYRRVLQPFLTRRAIARFAPLAHEIVDRLIDKFVESGRCDDAVSQLCYPFASEVQWGWLVGIEEDDRERVLEWIIAWTHHHFEPEYAEIERAWVEWTKSMISRRRLEGRRDDLIDGLLHTEVQGRPFTDDEIVGIVMIMIVGGVTTTADALSNILLRLAMFPDLQDRLRGDPKLLGTAVEEFLRIEAPALGPARRCTRDAQLAGEKIKPGEQLFVHLAAANRDPSRFPDPDVFDPTRSPNRHLAFGMGHHRCLGATFAQQNLRIVIERVLTRMIGIGVPEGAKAERRPGIVWGLQRLPLTFTAASGTSSFVVSRGDREPGAATDVAPE
jgi:cytochrome P450